MAEPRRDAEAVEVEVRALRGMVEDLTRRVVALERGAPTGTLAAPPRVEPPVPGEVPDAAAVLSGASRTLPYLGRLLLVLGGAYLLRSFTEDQTELATQLAGVGVGLTYAFVWIAAAWRALGRKAPTAAIWHAVAATVIAYPLLWETTVRLGLLPPPLGAVLLLVGTILGVGLAWRHECQAIAWLFVLGATLSALGALVPNADAAAPYTAALVLLGGITLWVGRTRGWVGLAAYSAAMADLGALVLIYHASASGRPVPLVAIAVLVFHLATYVGSITAYVLARWWTLDAFDVVQTALAVGLGLGGALHVARSTHTASAALCAVVLLLAVGLYVTGFALLGRERRRCFYYVTTVALALALLASASLLPQPAWPWAVLSILLGFVARRTGRMTLGVHAALYAAAAAISSGLLAWGAGAWLGLGRQPATSTGALVVSLLAAALGAVLRAPSRTAASEGATRAAQLLLMAIVAWGVGAWAVDLASTLLPTVRSAPDPAWLATVRTGVLAAIALLAAGAAHTSPLAPARHLVPLLLLVGALHLVLDDWRVGRPGTLAVSFALYGLVLILAPRIARSARRGEAPAKSPPTPEPSAEGGSTNA